MGKKSKEDKVKLDYLDRRKKIFNSVSNISYDIFINISDKQKVGESTEKGIRVLVARYPDFYKLYFYQYFPVGSPSYPRGGIKVWNATEEMMQSFYYESVALHPEGGYHKFYDKNDES
jgi:hypothetical protein